MNLSDWLPSSQTTLYKDKPSVTKTIPAKKNIKSSFNDMVSSFMGVLSGSQPQQSPQTLSATPLPSPTPVLSQPQAQIVPQSFNIGRAIDVYGGQDAPIKEHIPQMTEATKKYDFWKNNPELLALIPHLETSSGRNVTRPNNVTNWGINYPGNNETFSKMTQAQVLERFISGLGERSSIYKKFRTGKPLTDDELLEFARKYEPNNPTYGPNLVQGRNYMRQQMGI